jgi:hypothetical protein
LGLPLGYYVKEATYGKQNLLRQPWAPGSEEIRIVLGSDGASVSGRVVDENNEPVSDATVVLVPKRSAEEHGDVRIAAQPTDQNGQFQFASQVIPGDYLIVAVDGLSRDYAEDPKVVGPYLSEAIGISIGSRATQSVNLVALRIRD